MKVNINIIIKFVRFWQNRFGRIQWLVADQAIVSGFNFFTGVLLARFLGVEHYGQFVLLYAVLLYTNTNQFGLILAPMLSLAPKIDSKIERTKYLNGSLTLQLVFSIFISTSVYVVGIIISKWYSILYLQESILPLSFSILAFQLQDWLRRYFFICFKSKNVFINDLVSYGGQVFMLYLLHSWGKLNLASAFWIIFITSSIAFCIGIPFNSISLNLNNARLTFKKSWKFGQNLFLSGQINWASSQGILFIGGAALGTSSVGGIRAAQNIVGPLNIIFQGMENIIPIQASRHYYQDKLVGLTNYLKKTSLYGGLLVISLCTPIILCSNQLIIFAYGKEYAAYAPLIICQVLVVLMTFFRMQIFYFFRTTDNTKEIVYNTVFSFISTFVFAGFFWNQLQEIGIMLALITGAFTGLVHGLWSARKHYKLMHQENL